MTTRILGMALLLVFGWVGSAGATTATAPARECHNCTPTAMQTMAKNTPVGFTFIYDIQANIIRKYEVYMDSTCAPVHGGPSNGTAGRGNRRGNGTDCGSFKAADEMFPVDAAVQATFNALHDTWLHNPTLASAGEVARVSVLPNRLNGQPFDARYIAFDYPQNSYVEFMDYFRTQIGSRETANALAPDLGTYIYDWNVASLDVGPIIGAQPGLTFTITWDRSTTTTFTWWIPVSSDHIVLTITRSANGAVTVTYNGVLDIDNNYYPSRNGVPPGDQSSQDFPHHGGDHFDGGMQHGGIPTPDMPECGFAMHPFQVIARNQTTHQIIGVAYSCVPN